MSQPPYPPHYPQQPPYGAPTPRRKRPRVIWFFVAGGLLLLALVVFLTALFLVLRPLTQEDAVFTASESPYQVDLPADSERTLFTSNGFPVNCSATDGSDRQIEFRRVGGEFTYNEWTALYRFDTGDGNVTFDCTESPPGMEIRIGQTPSTGGFVGGLLVGIIVPMILGLAGVVMLIVVGVLFATGEPRKGPRPEQGNAP